jgi:DNA-binding NtrC family response regulator
MAGPTRRAAERRGSITRALPTRSGPMRAAVATLEKILGVDASVLLLGESGVGKDHVARLIHRLGPRSAGPFVTIDCAGIPAELFESELFGYEKGSFTDARESKPGRLESAAGGVVYLDEISAMSAAHQAKLLRVIDERRFTRVGGRKPADLDVRFVSSSNARLDESVASGRLRADLYFRLNVVTVELPPLRERREDIVALARGMLRDAARRYGRPVIGISKQAEAMLRAYAWPGNLREMAATIDRAVLAETGPTLSEASLPRETFGTGSALAAIGVSQRWSLEELERHYIRAVIADCGGNFSLAARVLGISRKALLEKRKRYGLDGSSRHAGDPSGGVND